MSGSIADLDKVYRDYAWKYFAQHAEQRLKAFHFYILFCGLVVGAFATVVSRSTLSPLHSVLPILLVVLSFVFWKLDVRTKMLIKNAEAALKYLDAQVLNKERADANVLALFERDDETTSSLPLYPLASGYFSYSRAFNWVYLSMTLAGVMGLAICFWAS